MKTENLVNDKENTSSKNQITQGKTNKYSLTRNMTYSAS